MDMHTHWQCFWLSSIFSGRTFSHRYWFFQDFLMFHYSSF
ncbi:hypothetical protein C7S14_5049 [Burkholderia cepacia]|nr:hypothetical protein C7S14_5049 [Burkholderia cepacia]